MERYIYFLLIEACKGFNQKKYPPTIGVLLCTDPDRIIPAATKAENENAKRKFSEAFDRVKKHLSMTFHRFLEAKSVAIHWCGHEIDDKYKGSCITKVWANGDFENLGEINLKGSNKTFVANTKQKTASY